MLVSPRRHPSWAAQRPSTLPLRAFASGSLYRQRASLAAPCQAATGTHWDWLLPCCADSQRVPLRRQPVQPRLRLHLSAQSWFSSARLSDDRLGCRFCPSQICSRLYFSCILQCRLRICVSLVWKHGRYNCQSRFGPPHEILPRI